MGEEKDEEENLMRERGAKLLPLLNSGGDFSKVDLTPLGSRLVGGGGGTTKKETRKKSRELFQESKEPIEDRKEEGEERK